MLLSSLENNKTKFKNTLYKKKIPQKNWKETVFTGKQEHIFFNITIFFFLTGKKKSFFTLAS